MPLNSDVKFVFALYHHLNICPLVCELGCLNWSSVEVIQYNILKKITHISFHGDSMNDTLWHFFLPYLHRELKLFLCESTGGHLVVNLCTASSAPQFPCFGKTPQKIPVIFYWNRCYIVMSKCTDDILFWNKWTLPVEVIPVDVGIEIVVRDVWEAARLVPEDVPWATAPTETPGPATTGWVDPADTVPCVVIGAVTPELVAVVGMAACGVGCPAGTSVALLSGRAMDMRESRRSSFSVSKELRLITGWDSMFISWPRGEVSRLNWAPSASALPPRGTVFIEALPLRLTFMLSSLTSRSQKSVEIPRDWRVAAVEPKEFGVLETLTLGLPRDPDLEPPPTPTPPTEVIEQRRESRSEEDVDRSLQRCWVKWLGNTCRDRQEIKRTSIIMT